MDRSLDASPCRFTDIGSYVECLRIIDLTKNADAAGRQFHHFGAGFWVEFFQIRLMLERDHHQVSAGIRVAIENYIGMLAAESDEILGAVFLLLRVAKDTPILPSTVFDIFHTPRGPNVIHRMVEL